jgi:hypothetical protein
MNANTQESNEKIKLAGQPLGAKSGDGDGRTSEVNRAKVENEGDMGSAASQPVGEANPEGSGLRRWARTLETDLRAVVDMIETIARSVEALASPLIRVVAFLSLLIVLAEIVARHFSR